MKFHYPSLSLALASIFISSSHLVASSQSKNTIANPILLDFDVQKIESSTSQPVDTMVNSKVVLDFDGQQIESGTRYYIFPTQNGTGGGLALASRDGTCPMYVMQENSRLSQGLALRFSPPDIKQPVINVSSDVNIVFTAATTCVQSTVWRVGGVDGITGERYVRSGGVAGRPGANTVSNWFKVEKFGDGYKIVFCPSVCSVCKVVCGDVGVFDENGKKWLGLSDEPLAVVFKKA